MLRRLASGALAGLVSLSLLEGSAAAQATPFSDSMVQAPELRAPQRGSVAGQYANVAFGPGDVSRGAFSLPLPVATPDERGAMQASPFPTYTPEAGASEWGLGWQVANLSIVRSRVLGDLDYATDDRTGPWGRMVRGTDGFWYPDGLRAQVRLEDDGDTLVAHTPDGARWTFGGAARVTTLRGTYAWHLTSVVDVLGRTTSFTYTANPSGRLFLADVTYGGLDPAKPAYDVHFSYEPLSVPLVEYRSGAAHVLDQRVRRITMSSLSGASPAERWRYAMSYTQDAPGPAFYLSGVQQTFASGDRPPPVAYGYGTASAFLASTPVARAPKLDTLVPLYGADVIQPNRSSSFDADDDGRPNLEFSYDQRLLVQGDAGFQLETLPPIDVTTDPVCRHAAYVGNAPRLVARVRSGDPDYSVVGLMSSGTGATTALSVCDRSGAPRYQAALDGRWVQSATTKLADLNRDQQPDLLSVYLGGYSVLPNASTAAGYAFGAQIRGTLTPAVNPDTAWVHDFNGDGIADLVGRVGPNLFVWPGKGSFTYDAGHGYPLIASSGLPITNLASYVVTFVDANGDGLTDALLNQGTSLMLFVNNGSQLVQVKVPAFAQVNWLSGRPVAADLAGSGHPSIAFIAAQKGYAIDLSAPPVGLLASANDGRGTVLGFTYAPAPPTPGVRARHSVLTNLSVASTGYDPASYSYSYAAPTLHSVGKFLVGFDQVSRRGALDSEVDSFLNGDDFAGLPSTSAQLDDLEPAVAKVAATTYADVTSSFGVTWKRKLTETKGWQSTSALSPASSVETTEYTAWTNDVCPASTTRTSDAGTLTTDTTFAPPFVSSFSCLPIRSALTGTHADPALDFRHEAAFARNDAGQVTAVTLYDRTGRALLAQRIGYTADGLLATVTNAGKGTATITYAPGSMLLQQTTGSAGLIGAVTERDPSTDAILQTAVDRGGATSYVESFRFDGQERLRTSWNNLGAAGDSRPDQSVTYRYADAANPALIEVSTLLDASSGATSRSAEVQSAAGEVLAKARLVPQGWAFGEVTQRSRATRTTKTMTKPTSGVDVATIGTAALYADALPVSVAQASAFGAPVAQATQVQTGVERDVASALSVSGGLVRADVENGAYTTVTTTDAAGRTTRVVDASGAPTTFAYDALGRVRRAVFADGAAHRVDYDDLGRPSRVDRDGVASVVYVYDDATGLLVERRYLGAAGSANAGALLRSVRYTYDAAGRVATLTHADPSRSSSFTYFYDGATPAAPTARGAAGLLTAVTGDGYAKTVTYRPDGTELSEVVTVAGWRQVETDLTYGEDAFVVGRTVIVRDAAGAELARDTEVVQRDAFGRVATSTRDGEPFETFTYDGNGLPASVTFGGPHAHGEVASVAYDALTRAKTTTTLHGAAWSSSFVQTMNARGLVGSESIAIGAFSRQRTYAYSAAGFLAQSTDADATYAYAYDAAGLPSDTTSTVAGIVEYRAFSRAGGVLRAGTHHHAFDDLGRAIERDDVAITYGPNGQIAHAESAAGSWDYLYDEAGQRIAKLAGGAPVAVYLADGSYLDAAARTVPLSIGGSTVGVLVEPTSGGAKSFQLTVTDARGSVLADADGTPHLPSPFGDRAAHPDVSPALDYATKGWDADLGVVRMGVRDYDPSLGRFLEPDPLFLEDLTRSVKSHVEGNLYGYAKGDPVLYRDPSGTCAEDLCIGEAVLVGEAVDALGPPTAAALTWAARAAFTFVAAAVVAKAETLLKKWANGTEYVFATYTVPLADGKTYSGRTAGIVQDGESVEEAANRIVADRWLGHHMRDAVLETAGEKARPTLDKFTSGTIDSSQSTKTLSELAWNYAAIRGREQQLIDHFGGAKSEKGSSGNKINGVARDNPLALDYYLAATTEFGVLPPGGGLVSPEAPSGDQAKP